MPRVRFLLTCCTVILEFALFDRLRSARILARPNKPAELDKPSRQIRLAHLARVLPVPFEPTVVENVRSSVARADLVFLVFLVLLVFPHVAQMNLDSNRNQLASRTAARQLAQC